MNRSNKTYFEILIGILLGIIISVFLFPKEVWSAEPVLIVPNGTTVIEDLSHPNFQEVKEAEQYLSENRIVIPEYIKGYCKQYGKEYGICPEILMAICWVESNCIEDIDNSQGCKGLMQVKHSCHRARMERLNCTDLHNAEENIKVGTDYLAELLETNDIRLSLALYNGHTNVNAGYINKVLKIAHALEVVHF